MKVLITGADGFIGRNLATTLKYARADVEALCYDLHDSPETLDAYARDADAVVHLAGVNRPEKVEDFLTGNAGFTGALADALERAGNAAPVIMTSSIQAVLDNPYGASKLAAEARLEAHERRTGARAIIYRLPNVFGKGCRPGYNSAVATFCFNIARGLPITVTGRAIELGLVYIDDVVRELIAAIDGRESGEVQPVYRATLGRIVDLLHGFNDNRATLAVPDLSDGFEAKLYATYLSYLPEDARAYPLATHSDARGSFTEFLRTDGRGQTSINVSRPGVVKGNHFHHTKNEKFLVVYGEAVIRIRRVGEARVDEYPVSGERLVVVDIPPGHTHNIENVGTGDMVAVMWASECFDPSSPDTYYLEV